MPLQGIFNADFSNFTAACAAAEVSLKGFETEATQTEKALNRMADSVSGKNIVQQAYLATKAVEDVGGAAVLTEKELARMSAIAAEGAEKLQRMGQTVPADMQKLASATKENADNTGIWSGAVSTLAGTFGALSLQRVIDEVIALGKAVFDDASALQNLEGRTGVGVETLQKLRVVGSETGVSLDSMAGSMNRLQKNIAEGSTETAGSLAQLGLSFQDIKNMSPEETYFKVVAALKEETNQNKLVDLGTQLMGKSFADTLPAIKHGFDEVANSSAGMSKTTVAALSSAGDATHAFYQSVKDNIGEAIGDILTLSTSEWRRYKDEIEKLPAVADTTGGAIKNMWGQILPPSVPKDLEEITTKSDAWGKASKAMAEAMVELDSAGKGWQGTLNTIDGTIAEAVKWYLEAGVAQDKLATAFGLTDVQVKAVDSSMKAAVKAAEDLTKAQAAADAIHMASYANTMKTLESVESANEKNTSGYQQRLELLARLDSAELELARSVYAQTTSEKERMKIVEDSGTRHLAIVNRMIELDQKQLGIVNAAVLAELDAQTKLNAAYGLTASGGIAQQETAYTRMTTALDTLHQKKVEGIDQTAQENVIYKTYTDALLEAARAEDAARDGAAGKNAEIAKTPGLLQAATAAMQSYQGGTKLPGSTTEQAFGQSYLTSPTGNRVQLGPHGELPDNWFDLYSGKSSFSSVISNLPRFASGVENFAGGLALVGERGPELVNLPGGSDVLPGLGGGGVTNHIVIHVNGTAAEVAQKVAAELMRTLKSGQQLTLR